MSSTKIPVWCLGKDDELIRQHLGADTLPDFACLMREPTDEFLLPQVGPTFRLGRFPTARNNGQRLNGQGREQWSPVGKGSVELFKIGIESKDFIAIARRFTLGQDRQLVRFQLNYKNGSARGLGRFRYASITFSESRRFRTANRPAIGRAKLKLHHKVMGSRGSAAGQLKLGVFNGQGLLKGAKSDVWWFFASTGIEVSIKLATDGPKAVWNYATDAERSLDLAKAIVGGVMTTAVTAAVVAGATTIAIIPIAAGLVASVVIGCALDELTNTDNVCRWTARQLLSSEPEKPETPNTASTLGRKPIF